MNSVMPCISACSFKKNKIMYMPTVKKEFWDARLNNVNSKKGVNFFRSSEKYVISREVLTENFVRKWDLNRESLEFLKDQDTGHPSIQGPKFLVIFQKNYLS